MEHNTSLAGGAAKNFTTYRDILRGSLKRLQQDYSLMLRDTSITDLDRSLIPSGINVWSLFGLQPRCWTTDSLEHSRLRDRALSQLQEQRRTWEPILHFFSPEDREEYDYVTSRMEAWATWTDTGLDPSIPRDIASLTERVDSIFVYMNCLLTELPDDVTPIRLVLDTNALMDNPSPTAYTEILGTKYWVHVPPTTLEEVDDLKRRASDKLRSDAARRIEKRLKGYRTQGDIGSGVKIEGEVWIVLEPGEPHPRDFPAVLRGASRDDRLAAFALHTRSRFPTCKVIVGTRDINLQTKLAAIRIPFIETPAQQLQ